GRAQRRLLLPRHAHRADRRAAAAAAAVPGLLPAVLRGRRALLLPAGDRDAAAAALPAPPHLSGRGGPRSLPGWAAVLRGRRAARPRGLQARLARGALRPAERGDRGPESRDGAHQQRQVPLAAAALWRAARADDPRGRSARRAGAVAATQPQLATDPEPPGRGPLAGRLGLRHGPGGCREPVVAGAD